LRDYTGQLVFLIWGYDIRNIDHQLAKPHIQRDFLIQNWELSVYGTTVAKEYPSTKRDKNLPEEIHRSENHHPKINDKYRFEEILKLREKRSNIEIDAKGNVVRKSTHYSMKNPKKAVREIKKPFND